MPVHDWSRVDAGIFHDFHLEWISTTKRALNSGLLPSDYYALAEQVAGGVEPDVLTLEKQSLDPKPVDGSNGTSNGGGVAVAAVPPKVRFTAVCEPDIYARKRRRIVIRHCSGDAVVAMIEIVSPGNKGSRHALRAFVEKAVDFLEAGIHLLILDLFPPGPRDPQGIHKAIWSEITEEDFKLPADKLLTLVAYTAANVKRAYIEPAAVGDVLPEMPLFLEPDFYIPVPLETTYRAAFDGVPKRWRDELEPPQPG